MHTTQWNESRSVLFEMSQFVGFIPFRPTDVSPSQHATSVTQKCNALVWTMGIQWPRPQIPKTQTWLKRKIGHNPLEDTEIPVVDPSSWSMFFGNDTLRFPWEWCAPLLPLCRPRSVPSWCPDRSAVCPAGWLLPDDPPVCAPAKNKKTQLFIGFGGLVESECWKNMQTSRTEMLLRLSSFRNTLVMEYFFGHPIQWFWQLHVQRKWGARGGEIKITRDRQAWSQRKITSTHSPDSRDCSDQPVAQVVRPNLTRSAKMGNVHNKGLCLNNSCIRKFAHVLHPQSGRVEHTSQHSGSSSQQLSANWPTLWHVGQTDKADGPGARKRQNVHLSTWICLSTCNSCLRIRRTSTPRIQNFWKPMWRLWRRRQRR